jgi:hypothetical protein
MLLEGEQLIFSRPLETGHFVCATKGDQIFCFKEIKGKRKFTSIADAKKYMKGIVSDLQGSQMQTLYNLIANEIVVTDRNVSAALQEFQIYVGASAVLLAKTRRVTPKLNVPVETEPEYTTVPTITWNFSAFMVGVKKEIYAELKNPNMNLSYFENLLGTLEINLDSVYELKTFNEMDVRFFVNSFKYMEDNLGFLALTSLAEEHEAVMGKFKNIIKIMV